MKTYDDLTDVINMAATCAASIDRSMGENHPWNVRCEGRLNGIFSAVECMTDKATYSAFVDAVIEAESEARS